MPGWSKNKSILLVQGRKRGAADDGGHFFSNVRSISLSSLISSPLCICHCVAFSNSASLATNRQREGKEGKKWRVSRNQVPAQFASVQGWQGKTRHETPK